MKYNEEYIAGLLKKFDAGTTSEAEEQELAEYFGMTDDVPKRWSGYKVLFESFSTNIYDFDAEELAEALRLNPTTVPARRRAVAWRWLSTACAVAAVLAIVIVMRDGGESVSNGYGQQAVAELTAVSEKPEETVVYDNKPMVSSQQGKQAAGAVNAHRGKTLRAEDVRVSAVGNADKMMACVTDAGEQVESYVVRNVGEASIVNKHYDDGTSQSYIVAVTDDKGGTMLVALND